MLTEHQRRIATAARAKRKEMEEAIELRTGFEANLRKYKDAQRLAQTTTAVKKQNPAWRKTAAEVMKVVRRATEKQVLSDMANVRTSGFKPDNWTAFMIWRMRKRLARPKRPDQRRTPVCGGSC